MTLLHKSKYHFRSVGSKELRTYPIHLFACLDIHKYPHAETHFLYCFHSDKNVFYMVENKLCSDRYIVTEKCSCPLLVSSHSHLVFLNDNTTEPIGIDSYF